MEFETQREASGRERQVNRNHARFILIVAAALTLTLVTVLGQQPPQKKYEPNEVQSLKLENAKLKAYMASQTAQQAQKDAQAAYDSWLQMAEQVKKENGWPANLAYNPQTNSYSEPPPAPQNPPHPATKEKP
jgi:hypothetical protein